MASTPMTVEEVMREIRQDILYYRYSKGGVTLSGGEALCQPDIVNAIVDACRKEGIETAVETNLLHPFETIAPVLKKMSLIMADVKLLDDTEHRKWTGVSNRIILENAKRLGELGIPLIFRTPLIPEATDSADNLRGIARFVAEIPNVEYYELLNFNPLGADKYTAMREDNPFSSARPFKPEQLAEFERMTQDCGVKIKIS